MWTDSITSISKGIKLFLLFDVIFVNKHITVICHSCAHALKQAQVVAGHLHTFWKLETFAESDVACLYEPTVRKKGKRKLRNNYKNAAA